MSDALSFRQATEADLDAILKSNTRRSAIPGPAVFSPTP
ncbi:hypothetical protein C4K18_5072 [Pseudomonas chlororaphis subsp. aurantiaca]|nr:hypothetical protein C4K18_5072 [Pseudomonas chlororaphis subsp. aurantiaca]